MSSRRWLPHALLDDGVTSGLADDDVSPLYNDNTDKESSMAGILQDFPLAIWLKQDENKLAYAQKMKGIFASSFQIKPKN